MLLKLPWLRLMPRPHYTQKFMFIYRTPGSLLCPPIVPLLQLLDHRQAYSYDVEYRPGSEHCNADDLSRLPCKQTDNPEAEVSFFSSIDELPISAADVCQATNREPVLAQVLKYILTGWPNYVTDEELKPYFTRKHELSTEQGCLLWGTRTIIPNSLIIILLCELYDTRRTSRHRSNEGNITKLYMVPVVATIKR